jgi:hypothetical protein
MCVGIFPTLRPSFLLITFSHINHDNLIIIYVFGNIVRKLIVLQITHTPSSLLIIVQAGVCVYNLKKNLRLPMSKNNFDVLFFDTFLNHNNAQNRNILLSFISLFLLVKCGIV